MAGRTALFVLTVSWASCSRPAVEAASHAHAGGPDASRPSLLRASNLDTNRFPSIDEILADPVLNAHGRTLSEAERLNLAAFIQASEAQLAEITRARSEAQQRFAEERYARGEGEPYSPEQQRIEAEGAAAVVLCGVKGQESKLIRIRFEDMPQLRTWLRSEEKIHQAVWTQVEDLLGPSPAVPSTPEHRDGHR